MEIALASVAAASGILAALTPLLWRSFSGFLTAEGRALRHIEQYQVLASSLPEGSEKNRVIDLLSRELDVVELKRRARAKSSEPGVTLLEMVRSQLEEARKAAKIEGLQNGASGIPLGVVMQGNSPYYYIGLQNYYSTEGARTGWLESSDPKTRGRLLDIDEEFEKGLANLDIRLFEQLSEFHGNLGDGIKLLQERIYHFSHLLLVRVVDITAVLGAESGGKITEEVSKVEVSRVDLELMSTLAEYDSELIDNMENMEQSHRIHASPEPQEWWDTVKGSAKRRPWINLSALLFRLARTILITVIIACVIVLPLGIWLLGAYLARVLDALM